MALIIFALITTGALSAYYRIIDMVAAVAWLGFYAFMGSFFNRVYPDAPEIYLWHYPKANSANGDAFGIFFDAHKMISWVLENGSPLANLLMFAPIIYLASKMFSEIYQLVQKIKQATLKCETDSCRRIFLRKNRFET